MTTTRRTVTQNRRPQTKDAPRVAPRRSRSSTAAEIDRQSRHVITWLPGERDARQGGPLLQPDDLKVILETLLSIEQECGWSPDME